MNANETIEHLKDILFEQKLKADYEIKEANELEFAKIAYNHGLSDLANRVLTILYQNDN